MHFHYHVYQQMVLINHYVILILFLHQFMSSYLLIYSILKYLVHGITLDMDLVLPLLDSFLMVQSMFHRLLHFIIVVDNNFEVLLMVLFPSNHFNTHHLML